MKFGKNPDGSEDKSTIIYNKYITIKNVPLIAYEYICGKKTAIEWIIDRQKVKIDKDSGIVNDANDWANETMSNYKFILELLLRLITVSLKTVSIINSLPRLDIYREQYEN